MQFGAMNFPVKPVLGELEAIGELGFDYLELAMDPPLATYQILRRQAHELRTALARRGMGLVCHLPTFISTADLTESIRRASLGEALLSLETAAFLGATVVVLHPGRPSGLGRYVLPQVRRHAMESLAVIVAEAERLRVTLCLENMFPTYGLFCEPDEFEEVINRFPGLQLTFDAAHAHIGTRREARPLEFIRRYGTRIGHVHFSDNNGRSDQHLPLGKGSLKFKKIAAALQAAGYHARVTLEVFSTDRRELKASLKTVAALLQPGGRKLGP
jgi:sugar phosphate isomerase/epimerase